MGLGAPPPTHTHIHPPMATCSLGLDMGARPCLNPVAATCIKPSGHNAAKCAFSEADMRRAHALERAARAFCREARSSERVSESVCLEIGMFGR